MQYKVRQKIFSIGDSFYITDEYDNNIFYVKGKVFTFGDKLTMEDMNGRELIYIEQKLFRFLPEYDIYFNGQHYAKVKKEFTFFKSKFNIDSAIGNYEINGDIFAHDFTILKNGSPVANVNKKYLAFSDTYMVDVSDSENQAFIMALVIVIDQVLHDNSSSGSHSSNSCNS